jgi:hypothetical protein
MEQTILYNLILMPSNVAKITHAPAVANVISFLILKSTSTIIPLITTNNTLFCWQFFESKKIEFKPFCNALPNHYAYAF